MSDKVTKRMWKWMITQSQIRTGPEGVITYVKWRLYRSKITGKDFKGSDQKSNFPRFTAGDDRFRLYLNAKEVCIDSEALRWLESLVQNLRLGKEKLGRVKSRTKKMAR